MISVFHGENDQSDGYAMDEAQGNTCQNMYPRGRKLVRRKGYAPISNNLGAHSLQGIGWFYTSAAEERVIGVYQGGVYEFWRNGAGYGGDPPLTTNGTNQFLGTFPITMAVVDKVLYMGGDNPGGTNNNGNVRYNGTSCASVGQPKPAFTPTCANGAVGGSVPAGNVTYVVTYVDTDGHESEPSPASLVFAADGVHKVTVTLPNAVDTQRSGKNLYRSGVNSSTYKRVNSTLIGSTAATYDDDAADASLGAAAVFGNTRFPRTTLLWQHDGRLWGALGGDDTNLGDTQTVYISNYLEPWYCPVVPDLTDPNQGMRLRIQSRSGYVNAGCSYGGYSIVFTGDGGYLVQGVDPNSYNIQKFTDHGCSAHRTLRAIRDKLYWLGPDGVYRFDGINTVRISQNEWEFFTGLSATDLAQAVAWVYEDRYYISTSAGCKYYDTYYEVWGRLAAVDVLDATDTVVSYQGNTGAPRVFASARGQGSIFQLEKNTDGDRSTANVLSAISCLWRSKVFDMGLPSRDKRIHLFGAKFIVGTGTASVRLAIGSGATLQTETLDLSTTDFPAYTATSPTVSVMQREASQDARSEFFQLQINHSDSTATDFQILDAELHWTLAG